MTNPILNELYEIRSQILEEHKDDLEDFLCSELQRTKASGHPLAKIQQRSIHGNAPTKSGVAFEKLSSPPIQTEVQQ